MMDDNFKKYGVNFQNKVLQALFTDREFFEKTYEILKKEYFSSLSHQIIYSEIKKYYAEYREQPTFETIKVEIKTNSAYDVNSEESRDQAVKALYDIEHKVNIAELKQAKEKAYEFCKHKAYENATINAVKSLKGGKYDAVEQIWKNVFKQTEYSKLGTDFFEQQMIEQRFQQSIRRCVPTGFEILDSLEYLDGGLAGGEMGIVLAPSGVGKSFYLVNLGYGAIKNGFNVLHYTFELSEFNIANRYDSRITTIPMKSIRDNKGLVKEKLKDFEKNSGRLIIKEYPPNHCTTDTIDFHMNKLESEDGFKPDLLVIDYGEKMKSKNVKWDGKRHEVDAVFNDLITFLKEKDLPAWVAHQTNRGGMDGQPIANDKMSESITPLQLAHVLLNYSRSDMQKANNEGTTFVGKNRVGTDGVALKNVADYSKALIDFKEIPKEEEKIKKVVESVGKKFLDEYKEEYRDITIG